MSKRITDNCLQIQAVKASNQGISKTQMTASLGIDEVINSIAAVTTSLNNMPSQLELRQYQDLMDDQSAQVEDINTVLTTAMEAYTVSESMPFQAQQAGPSGTQTHVNPDRGATKSP